MAIASRLGEAAAIDTRAVRADLAFLRAISVNFATRWLHTLPTETELFLVWASDVIARIHHTPTFETDATFHTST